MASPKAATGTRKARRRSPNAATRTATSASQNIRNDTAIAPPMPATCTIGVNAIWVCPKCQGNSRGVSSSASTTAVADRIASTSKRRARWRSITAIARNCSAPRPAKSAKTTPAPRIPNPPKTMTVLNTQWKPMTWPTTPAQYAAR